MRARGSTASTPCSGASPPGSRSPTRSPSCPATRPTSRATTRSSSASRSLTVVLHSRRERYAVPKEQEHQGDERRERRGPRCLEEEVGDDVDDAADRDG